MAHHGFLLHSPGLPPTSTGVVLQTFIQDTLLDWMEQGNAAPAKIILWTKGLQKVHLRRPPEEHPFPGALHQPTELRGPSVSSTCTALFNHQLLIDLAESCHAIICPPGTFSIQTLLLYFRHSHWLLFVLSFIVLSLDRGVLISGGRNARGKIMCFSFWQIFSILQPCNLNLLYRFRPSFCVLFVFWLDRFLDIFVITCTHKETTQHGNSICDSQTGRFSTRRWGVPYQGPGLCTSEAWSSVSHVFDSTRIVLNSA